MGEIDVIAWVKSLFNKTQTTSSAKIINKILKKINFYGLETYVDVDNLSYKEAHVYIRVMCVKYLFTINFNVYYSDSNNRWFVKLQDEQHKYEIPIDYIILVEDIEDEIIAKFNELDDKY